GWVATQRDPINFSKVRRDHQIRQICSLVSVPLWFKERLLGVLNLGHQEAGFYRQEDKPEFQKLAVQLSLIVEQLRLRDEIRDKNVQLEKLLEELQTAQNALVQKERLAAIGEVVVRIKHEINNPLSIIIGFTDLLSMQCPENLPEFAETLGKIKKAAQRIEHITKALEKVESSVAEEYLAGVKMLKIE
ncbi:MAG: histidine kinase dimerization/phospho-acceptor domain-containing protein, partial [Candidatus Neomarinimicrobiota bacterium]